MLGMLSSSLIDRLPPELLIQIFLLGLEDETYRDDDNVKEEHYDCSYYYLPSRGPAFPTIVASVCARWRHLALNTGSLWSVIRFGYSQHKESWPGWGSEEQVELWLKRSNMALLDLQLVCEGEDDSRYPAVNRSNDFVVMILESHLKRCRSLRLIIRTSDRADSRVFDALQANPSDTLERIEIGCGESNGPRRAGYKLAGLWPNLRELRLSMVYVRLNASTLQNLKRLELRSFYASTLEDNRFFALLRKCHSLVELHVEKPWGTDDFTSLFKADEHDISMYDTEEEEDSALKDRVSQRPSEFRLDLPDLKSLVVIDVEAPWFQKLASRLITPSLQHLTIQRLQTGTSIPSFPSLVDCLRNFNMSSVERLTLLSHAPEDLPHPHDSVQLLEWMPELTVLELYGLPDAMRLFLFALSSDADGGGAQVLCPKLNSLRLSWDEGHYPSRALEVVKLRKSSKRLSSIRSLHVHLWERPSYEELRALWQATDNLFIEGNADRLRPFAAPESLWRGSAVKICLDPFESTPPTTAAAAEIANGKTKLAALTAGFSYEGVQRARSWRRGGATKLVQS